MAGERYNNGTFQKWVLGICAALIVIGIGAQFTHSLGVASDLSSLKSDVKHIGNAVETLESNTTEVNENRRAISVNEKGIALVNENLKAIIDRLTRIEKKLDP